MKCENVPEMTRRCENITVIKVTEWLYEKYFKDRKEYIDEFKKYEDEYIRGMKDLYESVM